MSAPRGLVAGLALVVAGLGGVAVGYAAGGEGDRPLDEALADDLFARSDGMLTEAEARCAAPAIVAGIGADRLEEVEMVGSPDAGLPVSELTDDEERTFAAESYGCVEDANLAIHMAQMSFPPGETTAEERACLAEALVGHLGPERSRDALTQLFTKEAIAIQDVVTDDEQPAIDSLTEGCIGGGA